MWSILVIYRDYKASFFELFCNVSELQKYLYSGLEVKMYPNCLVMLP
jgi:hypothetical protein